jgi:hypothetical protein
MGFCKGLVRSISSLFAINVLSKINIAIICALQAGEGVSRAQQFLLKGSFIHMRLLLSITPVSRTFRFCFPANKTED